MRILLAATTLLLLGPFGSATPIKSGMMEDVSNLRGLQTNTSIAEPNTTSTTIAESKANEGVVGDACCEGEKPTSLTFQYTGKACDDSTDVENHPQNVGNKDKFKCSGTVGLTPVALDVPSGLTVTPIDGINTNDLQVGNEFIISGNFGSNLKIKVGGQNLTIHTSCSAPFPVDTDYGALKLIAYGPQTPECTPPPPPFCTNDEIGGPSQIDTGCVTGFPACIAAPGKDGDKCCVCQNTDASDGQDEGCGGGSGRPGLCFDGDKEPCFLEGGTNCVCIDNAEDGDTDSACTTAFPFCGQQVRGASGLGREAQFPSIDGNIGNGCFECRKDIDGNVFGCDPDDTCADDDGNEVEPGQLGTCFTISIPCDETQLSGGEGVTVTTINLGQPSGTFSVSYQMYSIPDQMDIEYEGVIIYTTGGPVSGSPNPNPTPVSYNGMSNFITVTMTGPSGTAWDFTIGCPTASAAIAGFTGDETNGCKRCKSICAAVGCDEELECGPICT